MKLTAVAVAAALALPLVGQSEPRKIIFHVSGVTRGEATDYCTTGKCSATRFTIGGSAADTDDGTLIEYVLDCVEMIANEPEPGPHITARCPRVHAHKDYVVTCDDDTIFFAASPYPPTSDKPLVLGYTIKSEKEVERQTDNTRHQSKK